MKNQKNNSKYLGHDYRDKSTVPHDLSNQYANFSYPVASLLLKNSILWQETNDTRKLISVLRNKEGWQIEDCRLSNGCKLYWLAEKGGSNE